MSITFRAPEAPTVEVTPFPDTDPDFRTTQSVLPEVNMSNVNALAMLRLMGLPVEYSGEVKPTQMGAVIARLLRAANCEGERAAALSETEVLDGGLQRRGTNGNVVHLSRGSTIYRCGRDDEYVARRCRDLLELFTQARANGYRVCWG